VKSEIAKVAAVLAAAPALLAASPAYAMVDERMNGDGTGLVFGINDGILGWVIFGVFSTTWFFWFQSQKDLGDFEDKDSGLKL
jgi:photosystem II PsbW protein